MKIDKLIFAEIQKSVKSSKRKVNNEELNKDFTLYNYPEKLYMCFQDLENFDLIKQITSFFVYTATTGDNFCKVEEINYTQQRIDALNEKINSLVVDETKLQSKEEYANEFFKENKVRPEGDFLNSLYKVNVIEKAQKDIEKEKEDLLQSIENLKKDPIKFTIKLKPTTPIEENIKGYKAAILNSYLSVYKFLAGCDLQVEKAKKAKKKAVNLLDLMSEEEQKAQLKYLQAKFKE